MKTSDPSGWVKGKTIEAYMRYIYILSTDDKIYKYERLANSYGAAAQYNVNGNLTGALDMAIDSSFYVLKKDGTVVKLLRGESKPFSIRNLPPDALKTATKIIKISDGNFYFLDPAKNRIIVTSNDGTTGESLFLKQYTLSGYRFGKLQDLYVDPDQKSLYVIDEKRVFHATLPK